VYGHGGGSTKDHKQREKYKTGNDRGETAHTTVLFERRKGAKEGKERPRKRMGGKGSNVGVWSRGGGELLPDEVGEKKGGVR